MLPLQKIRSWMCASAGAVSGTLTLTGSVSLLHNKELTQRLESQWPGHTFHIGLHCLSSTEKNVCLLPKVTSLSEDILKSDKESSPLPSPLKDLQKVTNLKVKTSKKIFIMQIFKKFFLYSLGLQLKKYLACFFIQDFHYTWKLLPHLLHYKMTAQRHCSKVNADGKLMLFLPKY